MKLKRIGVLSLAKFQGALMAAIGLLIGLIFGIFSGLMLLFGSWMHISGIGKMLGISISLIIFLPILYGVSGFVLGALIAFLYNLIAKWTGGIDFEFDTDSDKNQYENSNENKEDVNESIDDGQENSEHRFEEM